MCNEQKTNDIPEGCAPFDLQKALAGEPLTTRNGRAATGFFNSGSSGLYRYVYRAYVDGALRDFDFEGNHCALGDLKLFMVNPPPAVDNSPQAQQARAWERVFAALNDHNPKIPRSIGVEMALNEIKRLQALDVKAPEPKKSERRPFDLEAAKRGEPLVTRDGYEAKFIGVNPIGM